MYVQEELHHQEFDYDQSKNKILKRILIHSTIIMVFSFFIGVILYSGTKTQSIQEGQCRILLQFSEFSSTIFIFAGAVRLLFIFWALFYVFLSHGFIQLYMIQNKLQAAETFSCLLFFFIGCWLTEIKEQCGSFGLLVLFVIVVIFIASMVCILNGDIEFVNGELVWNQEEEQIL